MQHVSCVMLMLSRWLSEHRSCPCCRSPITTEDLRPIHRVWREKLVELRMKCYNSDHGCTAVVSIEELPDHLSTCQYAHVPCPHTACPEVVIRTMLDEHVRVCEHRMILCDDCGLEFQAIASESHKCILSLRQYVKEQIEAAKKEMITECTKLMRRERRYYENLLQEQKRAVDELRHTLSNLISQQHTTTKINTVQLGHSASCPRGVSRAAANSHRTAEGRNLSLPRLAPLHTHMNLPRTGGNLTIWCTLNKSLFNRSIKVSIR